MSILEIAPSLFYTFDSFANHQNCICKYNKHTKNVYFLKRLLPSEKLSEKRCKTPVSPGVEGRIFVVGWSVGGHPGGRGVVRIRPRPWPNAPPQSQSDPETKQKELVHFKVEQKGIGGMKHVFFDVPER